MKNETPKVIYEDNHHLVLYKPFRMPSQSDTSGSADILSWGKQFLKKKYKKKGNVYLALVHRLDRPVAGLMVFGKTSKAAERLSRQFRENQVKKKYFAVVYGKPHRKAGIIKNYLWKDKSKNTSYVVRASKRNAKQAVTKYEVLDTRSRKQGEVYSLLRLSPITGRSHQLRVHMKHLRHPIVGDLKYGIKQALAYQGIALLAAELIFKHVITGETLKFSVEEPPPLFPWNLFDAKNFRTKK